jgi:hypothetical protein
MKCEGKNITKTEDGVVICCDTRREDGCSHLVIVNINTVHVYLCTKSKEETE